MGPQTLRARRVRHRNSDGRAARGSTPLRPLRCWADRCEQPRSPQSGDARGAFMARAWVLRSSRFRHPTSMHYSGGVVLIAHAVCAEAAHNVNQLKEYP